MLTDFIQFLSDNSHVRMTIAQFIVVAVSIGVSQMYFRAGAKLFGFFFVSLGIFEGWRGIASMLEHTGHFYDATYMRNIEPFVIAPVMVIGAICLAVGMCRYMAAHRPVAYLLNGLFSVCLIWAITIGVVATVDSHSKELAAIKTFVKYHVGLLSDEGNREYIRRSVKEVTTLPTKDDGYVSGFSGNGRSNENNRQE